MTAPATGPAEAAGSEESPSSSPTARLDRASVRYAGTEVWIPQGVTLSLPAGTTTVLLGPSGCGKSTVTLTLNGLVPHSVPSDYRGSVIVAGREVADAEIAHLARHVAMVMQDPDSQIVTTRVLDEVCYALENLLMPVDEIAPRAITALDGVGRAAHAESTPGELSGGQRQRVVLAAALAVEPALLVLDEPTANLDPVGSADFYALLPALKKRGTAILIVEHDLDDLIGAVDRIIALEADGTAIAVGSPVEILDAHGKALAAAGIRLPTAVRLHHLLAELTELPTKPGLAAADDDSVPPLPLTLDDAAHELAALPSFTPLGSESADDPVHQGTGKEPVMVVRGLSVPRGRGRRRREVLHDISLDLRRGEILSVIGVNGSGKSTLLRALAGLQKWTSGTVSVAGHPRRSGRTGRAVTLVMQNPEHQFLERTVSDELAHGMRLEGITKNRIDQAVADMLSRFGLTDHAETNPFLLSGGQQRRLSVASVLGEHREVICLDEPTFGQDHRSAEALMSRLRDVAAEGAGLIISTHDMELAAEYADRVLILVEGAVAGIGPAREILANTSLLARSGLRPPALARLTHAAAALGAAAPCLVSWKELA